MISLLKWISGGWYGTENKQSSLPPLIAVLRAKLGNYFSTCASLMAFYAAITLHVGQLPSKKRKKKLWLTLFKSLPMPLMWRVALSRGSQENHAVHIEKNLISPCLGNVIRLLKCSPWKKWVGTWEGKVMGGMLVPLELGDDSSLDHMTQCHETLNIFTHIFAFCFLPTIYR